MKNLTSILIVLIVLSGIGLGVTFFVLKNKKKPTPTPSTPQPIDPAPTEPKPPSNKNELPLELQANIEAPFVDTVNRSFEYTMNYLGIQHKGEFKEGGINPFVLQKSFGTFVVRQRPPEMETVKVPRDKNNKMTGGTTTTKGDKMSGGTTEYIEVKIPKPSNVVDLEIRTKGNHIVRSLAVNLATGVKIGGIHADPNQNDGD